MYKQLQYITMLFMNLKESCEAHMNNEKKLMDKPKEQRYYISSGNYLNKNHGKCALKRKITMLRQELLNLEKMLDEKTA